MSGPAMALMDAEEMRCALEGLADAVAGKRCHETPMALIGIRTRGVPLAGRLARILRERYAIEAPVGALDITLYRDDLSQIAHTPVLRGTEVPFSVDAREVVLVDDVLFTGRTIRAAMDAVCDLGRPSAVRLAVLIDRGHRELPIQPDYCSRRVETQSGERIEVRVRECDGVDEVVKEGG